MGASQVQQNSEATLEFLGALITSLNNFLVEGHGHDSQGEDLDDLSFVNPIMNGLTVVNLVDTSANQKFIGEHTATTLHCNPNRNMTKFNVLNSTMRLV